MQNQEFYSSGYFFGFITAIIVTVIAIGVNCYCLYKIFLEKVAKCRCNDDTEKNLPGPNEEVSGLENLNDDSVKQSSQVGNQSTCENTSIIEDAPNVSKTKATNSNSQTISTSESNTKPGENVSNVEKMERLVRKMEIENLVLKMEQQQTPGSELTSHMEDNHKNSKPLETSKPIEYKSIPTNINVDADILPTIWKEGELMRVHVQKK